jgi:hypothetical protein
VIGSETIYLVTPAAAGRHGEPSGEPTRRKVEGCALYPRGSTETDGRTSTVITGMTLLAPPGTEVHPKEHVEWRGDAYDVEGRPGPWVHLAGDDAGVQIALERREDV